MSSWLSRHLTSDVLEDWHDRQEAKRLARVKWLGGLTNSTAVGALAAKMTGEKPPQTLTYEQHVDIEMARIQGRKQAELEARRRRLCPTIEEQMQDALEDGKRQAAERRRAAPPTPTPATAQGEMVQPLAAPNPAPASTEQVEPEQAVQASHARATAEQRRARRFQMCIDAGLKMPGNDYASLPRGIAEIAKQEGITRQSLAEDLKAHIRRLHDR
ncbi:hypothetical protein [Malikia sp.]|uniref:hypothetical protein n=1 Tax=Malikia sp. TaxID=2070706 RepID=UPI00260DBD46|nr:hypothetical protein [Malikia sp.]MDD2729175.1 hypothetical protein [Malikia sp.]